MTQNAQSLVDDRDEYRWLGALAVGTCAVLLVGTAAALRSGTVASGVIHNYMATIILLVPLTAFLGMVGFAVSSIIGRRQTPIVDLLALLRSRFRSPAATAGILTPLILTPVLMGSFGALKMIMPVYRDFVWDDRLAAADRMLFLGWQPWQITHLLFGSPAATKAIDTLYTLWVPMLFIAVLLAACSSNRYLRARFFLSFSMAWVLIGTVGAYALASAGPCYAALNGAQQAGDYAALMARLHAIDDSGWSLGAVHWQAVLWDAHRQQHYGFAMGISAMPSMHNAITTLYVLSLAGMGQPARLASQLFWVIIFVGSIHLGWHYALDGLVAAAATWAIWRLAGVYLRWSGYESAVQGARRALPQLNAPGGMVAA